MEIKKHFDDYIKENNITSDIESDIESDIQVIGYVKFFNEITSKCLGKPSFTHDKFNETSSSLVYVSDATKEKFIKNLDILYVSNLYLGIMTNGKMDFNYPNYTEFLKKLMNTRTEIKRTIKENNDSNLTKIQFLIKLYLNLVYGMLDKTDTLLTSGLDEPRKYIVDTSKKVMASIVSFYLNKSLPIFYVDTDEIFTTKIDDKTLPYLEEHFKRLCGEFINIEISEICIDEKNYSGIIYGKKRYMISKSVKVVGLQEVDLDTVLIQNKKYFGRNFRDIFPEYTI